MLYCEFWAWRLNDFSSLFLKLSSDFGHLLLPYLRGKFLENQTKFRCQMKDHDYSFWPYSGVIKVFTISWKLWEKFAMGGHLLQKLLYCEFSARFSNDFSPLFWKLGSNFRYSLLRYLGVIVLKNEKNSSMSDERSWLLFLTVSDVIKALYIHIRLWLYWRNFCKEREIFFMHI